MGNILTKTTVEKQEGIKYIELWPKLSITDPKDVFEYQPESSVAALAKFAKEYEEMCHRKSQQRSNKDLTFRTDVVEDRTPTIGYEQQIYPDGSSGFFDSVLTAYNNHFNLRTSPDDWWFCVIRRVAFAADKNSKNQKVRKMFVDHEGKKQLTVQVPVLNIYDVDYADFFNAMSTEVSRNIKVPEYVDCVTADFTTSTSVTRIVSQITLMSSVQEYFEFWMYLGCGIPGIEMTGTEHDWKKLLSKLKVLRRVLKPIDAELGLTRRWWSLVEKVFTNLLQTYRGKPDKRWWSHIMTYKRANGSSVSFLSSKGPSGYCGWIVEFLEGKVGLEKGEFCSGISTVPLYIDSGGGTDKAALVAGMAGYTVHDGIRNERASIQTVPGMGTIAERRFASSSPLDDSDKSRHD